MTSTLDNRVTIELPEDEARVLFEVVYRGADWFDQEADLAPTVKEEEFYLKVADDVRRMARNIMGQVMTQVRIRAMGEQDE